MQALGSISNHHVNCYRAFTWKCYRKITELLQSISGIATELLQFRHTVLLQNDGLRGPLRGSRDRGLRGELIDVLVFLLERIALYAVRGSRV